MSVSTFLHSVSVLLPVLFVMALGFCAGRAKEFDREQLDGLTELVLKYALPALLPILSRSTAWRQEQMGVRS
jgi:predicted permease